MKKVDVIIVGQGIAGTVLAFSCLQNGLSVHIIDSGKTDNASRAAAGLYNPVTGRKMVKTWLADELFSYLIDFYSDHEKFLDSQFLFPTPIYRPFINVEEQNDWLGNSSNPQYQPFIQSVETKSKNIHEILDPFGGLVLDKCGYLDLPVFLDSARTYFSSKGIYQMELFDINKMKTEEDYLAYGDIVGERVIFCEGTDVERNPFWSHLKFRPVKGEVMDIETEKIPNLIVNRGVFMIPKEGYIRVGSTYDNKDLSKEVTVKGINSLKEKLEKIFKGEYRIIRSWAGIRPATYDRRPFIGFHPENKKVGIFNGFGAKGVSLAPFFAKLFVENIMSGKALPAEVSVDR